MTDKHINSEQKFSIKDSTLINFAEQIKDGVIIIQKSKIVYANQSLADLIGYSVKEMLNRSFFDFIDPHKLKTVMEYYRKRTKRENVPSVYETVLLHKEGYPVFIEINTNVVDIDEKQTGIGIIRDITNRKILEQEIQEDEKLLEAGFSELSHICNKIPVGLAWFDLDLQFKRVNDRFSFFTGKKGFEHIGSSVDEILPKTAEFIKPFLNEALNTGKPIIDKEVEIKKDKETVYWMIHCYPVKFEQGNVKGVGMVVEDVTRRKNAEKAVLEKERLKSVLEMAGAACHNINQPLQILSLSIGMLLNKTSEDDPLYGLIQKINAAYERMAEITTKLSNITSYETCDYHDTVKIIDIDKATAKKNSED